MSILKVFNIFLIFSSFLASLLCFLYLENSFNFEYLKYVIFIPFFFGISFYLILFNSWNPGPGQLVLIGILYLKSVIFYPVFVASNFNSDVLPIILSKQSVFITYAAILGEILIIFLTIRFFNFRRVVYRFIKYNHNYVFLFILIIMSLFFLFYDKDILKNFHFVFDSSRYADLSYSFGDEEMVYGSTIGLEIIKFTIVFFNLYWLQYFSRKFFINFKFKFILISVLPILVFSLFYIGISRSSIFLPFLCYIFLNIKIYSIFSRRIIVFITTYLIIIIAVLSIFKQFRTDSISYGASEFITLAFLSNFINGYTNSWPNTYRGFLAFEDYKGEIDLSIITNDFLSSIPFIHRLADMNDRSNVIFNDALSTKYQDSSRILPMTSQSYIHFGILFIFLYTFLSTLIILFFENKFYQSSDIFFSYAFLFIAISVAFSISHLFSFHVIGRIFRVFLPIFVLALVNKKVIFKF